MKVVLFMLLFQALNGFATVIEDERGKIAIELNKDWKYEKNLMGLPHVFLSSEKPERSTLSITLSGLASISLSPSSLKKNEDQYKEGRKKWAEERNIKITNFQSYDSFQVKAGQTIHEIGFDYLLNKTNYTERSYFLECPNSLVHLKILGTKGSAKIKEAQNALKSVQCL